MTNSIKQQAERQFSLDGQQYYYYSLDTLQELGYDMIHMPYSVKVLLESVLRQCDGKAITEEHIKKLANWTKEHNQESEVPFKPSRVILQDFTGVPAVVDLTSLRQAMATVGGDVSKIDPEVRVDLVIDHSVQVDQYGMKSSVDENIKMEFERNKERYQFLKWAQKVFPNFHAIPPATGIVHQVNLEYLAEVVVKKKEGDKTYVYPDSLVGTDSHTTMINGLGVLGWGVGGIEAEAGMLGQPSFFTIPEVVGVRFIGELPVGATATDLALRITQLLRQKGVVGKFVEFFGKGVKELPLADRATIANMAPEYGATCGFFPVDEETLAYLRLTGREEKHIQLVKEYLKQNHMFYENDEVEPRFSEVIELDLSTITTHLSGPKRPQDLIPLSKMKEEFQHSISLPLGNQGHGLTEQEFEKQVEISLKDGRKSTLTTGSVVIAAITSCTNTSNPYVMLGAGLLAKNAVNMGLTVPAHVKTSLAPGSKVVTGYLEEAGLQQYLDKLGFYTVGYGCTTCIGNSGPLLPEIEEAITEHNLLVSSVLSGNRNFEGRIHPLVKANYLASPMLVVAYALSGTVDIDMNKEPIGISKDGKEVFLKDIWPSMKEIDQVVRKNLTPELFRKEYEHVYEDNQLWNSIEVGQSPLYSFDKESTYIQNPTFFTNLSKEPMPVKALENLRVICKLGDSVTTDHISPAGVIGKNSPAGKYLLAHGVTVREFNSYGSRRGNHEVMMRGTFANTRIRNQIAPNTEGGYTTYWPTKEVMAIYDACMKYKETDTGLVVLAGKDYGMGSSRDWAAKGTSLLGIRLVIAESYERIHRSNLVMMGVLPLQYIDGQTADSLGLHGDESFRVMINEEVRPHDRVQVTAIRPDGSVIEFTAVVRFDSEVDIEYYRHGGILQMILRQKLEQN